MDNQTPAQVPALPAVVLIDDSYMLYGRRRLDIAKLFGLPGNIVEVRCYLSPPPATGDEQEMKRSMAYVRRTRYLRKQGIVVYEGKTKFIPKTGEVQQKQVDTKLSIDACTLAINGKAKHVYLVTGDCDFVPVIEMLHEHNVTCTLISYAHSTAPELKQRADAWMDVEHILQPKTPSLPSATAA